MLTLISLLLSIGVIVQGVIPNNQPARLVTVGSHKMFLNCTGDASGLSVILEAGTGDTSEVWSAVQQQVEKFALVCSYDRLGLGKSDKPTSRHRADEIVNDLNGLLLAASVSPPYVMVGHSIGGIYVRKYAELYPNRVTGIVLLGSAHEEQFSRVSAISPEWAQRIASKFPAAGRSKYGELREATKSGHYIQRDHPNLLSRQSRTSCERMRRWEINRVCSWRIGHPKTIHLDV